MLIDCTKKVEEEQTGMGRQPAARLNSYQTANTRLFEVGNDVFAETLQGVHDYLAGDG